VQGDGSDPPRARLLPSAAARALLAQGRRRLALLQAAPTHTRKGEPSVKPKIVFNKLLGGWYVVRGPHQTPLGGRFDSKAQAQAWLNRQR